MKYFDTYVKLARYYGKSNTIHPRLVKVKLLHIEVQEIDNLIPEEKEKSEGGFKEDYLS